jgi:hypothetical protein
MNMYIQTLSQAFAKFSDKTLLNPNRVTSDVDTVAEEIREEAEQYGLEVCFEFPDQTVTDVRDDRLLVAVKNEGGMFKVNGFNGGHFLLAERPAVKRPLFSLPGRLARAKCRDLRKPH